MEEYAVIMRHQDGKAVASPEQIQAWMQQTMAWIKTMADQGKFVSGTGLLFQDAHVVHHKGVVTQGPFGDIKETLGGLLIIKASSMEEAVEFAKGSPVLQGEGNTVEVRRIATK
jgi:hypothetical protein